MCALWIPVKSTNKFSIITIVHTHIYVHAILAHTVTHIESNESAPLYNEIAWIV